MKPTIYFTLFTLLYVLPTLGFTQFSTQTFPDRVEFLDGTTTKGYLRHSTNRLLLETLGGSENELHLSAPTKMILRTNSGKALTAINGRVGIGEVPFFIDKLFIKQDGGGNALAIQNLGNGNDIYAFEIGVSALLIKYHATGGRPASVAQISPTGAYIDTSDKRLKDNIDPMPSVLDKVMHLRPTTYTFKQQENKTQKTLGFLAQEVAEVMPEIVRKIDGSDQFGLRYADFGIIAIKAIQELNIALSEKDQLIANQKEELYIQRQALTDLASRLDQLEVINIKIPVDNKESNGFLTNVGIRFSFNL